MRVYGRNYNTGTNTWEYVGDSLLRDGYYTTTFTRNDQTVAYTPAFTGGNLVGLPEPIIFDWPNNPPALNAASNDRFIVFTDHDGMRFIDEGTTCTNA